MRDFDPTESEIRGPASGYHATAGDVQTVCDDIRTRCWKASQNVLRAQAGNHELGMLLSVVRKAGSAFDEQGRPCSFEEFVAGISDKNGQPRTKQWAEKLIEMSRTIDPWPGARAYLVHRMEDPLGYKCRHPELSMRGETRMRFPCVSDGSLFRAARLADRIGVFDTKLEELAKKKPGAPAELLRSSARAATEKEIVRLAHLTIEDLNRRLRAAHGTTNEEPKLKRIFLQIDPTVWKRFREVADWASTTELHGEGDAIDPEKASMTQKIERLTNVMETVKDAIEAKHPPPPRPAAVDEEE